MPKPFRLLSPSFSHTITACYTNLGAFESLRPVLTSRLRSIFSVLESLCRQGGEGQHPGFPLLLTGKLRGSQRGITVTNCLAGMPPAVIKCQGLLWVCGVPQQQRLGETLKAHQAQHAQPGNASQTLWSQACSLKAGLQGQFMGPNHQVQAITGARKAVLSSAGTSCSGLGTALMKMIHVHGEHLHSIEEHRIQPRTASSSKAVPDVVDCLS